MDGGKVGKKKMVSSPLCYYYKRLEHAKILEFMQDYEAIAN